MTEEELFASVAEAVPTSATQLEYTKEQEESPKGHQAFVANPHGLQYATNRSVGLDEGAGSTACEDLPWTSPPSVEAYDFGAAQLDDKELLFPDSPLKPTKPQSNQSALLGDRELHFLLDALLPDGNPVAGDSASSPRKGSSQMGSATGNVPPIQKIWSLNDTAPHVQPNYASHLHALDNRQRGTREAHITQSSSRVASPHPPGAPPRRISDEGICIPTTQNQQPIHSSEATSVNACASTSAPWEITGQSKAKCLCEKLCCRVGSDRKCCMRREKAAEAGLQSAVCSDIDAGAGAVRPRYSKLFRMPCCGRPKV